MKNIDEIKQDRDLINRIDWQMTPEEAVRLYLEWGNNWARGNYVIRSKDDVAHYFVVNTWGNEPVVYLVRRNSEEAMELAQIKMPQQLKDQFMVSVGHHKGVYAVEGDVKNWLKSELAVG